MSKAKKRTKNYFIISTKEWCFLGTFVCLRLEQKRSLASCNRKSLSLSLLLALYSLVDSYQISSWRELWSFAMLADFPNGFFFFLCFPRCFGRPSVSYFQLQLHAFWYPYEPTNQPEAEGINSILFYFSTRSRIFFALGSVLEAVLPLPFPIRHDWKAGDSGGRFHGNAKKEKKLTFPSLSFFTLRFCAQRERSIFYLSIFLLLRYACKYSTCDTFCTYL